MEKIALDVTRGDVILLGPRSMKARVSDNRIIELLVSGKTRTKCCVCCLPQGQKKDIQVFYDWQETVPLWKPKPKPKRLAFVSRLAWLLGLGKIKLAN